MPGESGKAFICERPLADGRAARESSSLPQWRSAGYALINPVFTWMENRGGMRCKLRLFSSLAAVLLAGAPPAAAAQSPLFSTPTTQVDSDGDGGNIQLDVQATLDFDRLVLLGRGNGAAILLANGERSASGSVATVSARAMVGSITVHGDPNRALRVELPGSIQLYSLSGGKISVDQLGTDLSEMPRLDSAGNLTFRFGGRLQVTGDADGEYRGDIPITVEYL
jgi:hypothetical protein